MIDESHILAEASRKGHFSGAEISTTTDFNPTGKYRLKTMDVRLSKLGVKQKNEKMPMNIRKGMNAKNAQRKQKTITEAKEAGIILARPTAAATKGPIKKRDRGLKIASIGKNTRHGLVISKSEIAKYTSGKGHGKKRR